MFATGENAPYFFAFRFSLFTFPEETMVINQKHRLRYVAIAVIFCTVCLIYLGRLLYIQITGNDRDQESELQTRTVTVSAVRGEIYDREGRALVSNQYSYDLTLSYNAFTALGAREGNKTCLSLLEALSAGGDADKHTERFFPFEGSYPYYSLSAEASDPDSIPYYRMQRVRKALNLKEDATPNDYAERYVELYGLLDTANDGTRLFGDDEIDRLIRLRYDMDAQAFRTNGEYVMAEEISLSTMTYVKELSLDGVTFGINVSRVYNYPGYASHILGTVGPIYSEEWEAYNEQGYQMNAMVGKSGCELAFEAYLHGSDGQMQITTDADGNVVETKVLREPVAGSDVHLTIDIDLQIAAEDGLAENTQYVVDKSGGSTSLGAGCNAGAAVVMDPDTFSVLAIASHPTYDLSTYNISYNDLLADEARPLINRALNGLYEPGSTFKLGVAAAALESGTITADTRFACNGKYPFGSYSPECSTHPHTSVFGTNRLNVVQAIAVSCNVFFYETGYQMKIDPLNTYMRAFGFGQSTGLEIGGSEGILAGPNDSPQFGWDDGQILQTSIGQSYNQASPLQLSVYLSTLLGGGTRYKAHLLDSVYSLGADTPSYAYTQSEETVLGRIALSEETVNTVRAGMEQVVKTNAVVNRFLGDLPISVGGKTGTAQNSKGCENALFVCAAPLDDPEIVISVVLEQGYTGGYASLTAARILEKYLEKR